MSKEVIIEGIKYVPASSAHNPAKSLKGMPYMIVRTYSAGVFAGYLEKRNGMEVILRNVRRLWYWSGACSLSQLAVEGTKKPNDCKFAMEVDEIELTQVIEIIKVTKEAQDNILSVAIWKS